MFSLPQGGGVVVRRLPKRLEGPFSAVSKPTFFWLNLHFVFFKTFKIVFEDLQDLHPSAPLRTRILQVFAPLRELSLNFPKFAKFRLKALNPISRIDYFSSNISRNFAVIAWSPMYSPEGILLNLFYKKCLHKMFWTYKKVCKMNNLDQFG